MSDQYYTNEQLSKKFNSKFELVGHAIEMAKEMIRTGREARVKMDTQNPALIVLEEIRRGRDRVGAAEIDSIHAEDEDELEEEFEGLHIEFKVDEELIGDSLQVVEFEE